MTLYAIAALSPRIRLPMALSLDKPSLGVAKSYASGGSRVKRRVRRDYLLLNPGRAMRSASEGEGG